MDQGKTIVKFDKVRDGDRVLNAFADWRDRTEGVPSDAEFVGVSEGRYRTNLTAEQLKPLFAELRINSGYRYETGGEDVPISPEMAETDSDYAPPVVESFGRGARSRTPKSDYMTNEPTDD
jgi:hypothetical protein